MGSFLPLPMTPEQRLQEEMRRLYMQKLAQQQWQPPQQQPQARPLPGGLPYPPSPREVGRQQMAKVRQQATEEIIGPESRVPGYQGPSAQQVSSQGPTMAAGPSRLDRMMSALKPAARMAESVISPVDAETGMPNVAIGPLSGVGSADDAMRAMRGGASRKTIPEIQAAIDEVELALEKKGFDPTKMFDPDDAKMAFMAEPPASWKPQPPELAALYRARYALERASTEEVVSIAEQRLSSLIPDPAKRKAFARRITQADIAPANRMDTMTESWRGIGELANEVTRYVSKNVIHDPPKTAFNIWASIAGTADNPGIKLALVSEPGLGPSPETIKEAQRWMDILTDGAAPRLPGFSTGQGSPDVAKKLLLSAPQTTAPRPSVASPLPTAAPPPPPPTPAAAPAGGGFGGTPPPPPPPSPGSVPPPPGGGSRLTERILNRADIRKGLKHVSEAEERHWDDFLETWSETTKELPQETIPFSVIQEEARKLDPALVSRIIQAPPGDPIRRPAVFKAARERVNGLNATILKMSEGLKADLPAAETAALQGKIAVLEKDAKGILDWIFRTGSEDGRNLAYHGSMAEQSFDDVYWLNRARRLAGGGIDDGTHRNIIQSLADGRAAQEAGDIAGQQAARKAVALELAKTQKSGFWETASAVRKAGLLTGVKTTARNLGGNTAMQVMEETARLPASIIDASISIFSKQHTVVPGAGMWTALKTGGSRGLKEGWEILKQGATTDDLLKMDIPRELNSGSKVLDLYSKGVFRWMSAQDRPFRAYAYDRAIQEQAISAAMTARRAGGRQSIGAMAKELAANPSELMKQQALAYSEFAVFANQTEATESARRALSALSPAKQFAVDLFVPFKTTPANYVARVIEYSGGGLLKGGYNSSKAIDQKIAGKAMTPAQQHEISMAFGRGLMGPALLYTGWKLAESGQMTGMTPETPGERATMEEAGRLPGAILIDGKWQQVAGIGGPGANVMVIGATLYEQETKAKPATLPSAIGTAAVRTVAEQPFLSGMEDITSVLQSSSNLADAAEKTGQRLIGSFVPTIVADAGRAMDPYRRDTRNQGLMASAKERIPGLRKDLPTRRGVLGEPLPSSPTAFWNPGIGSPAREMSDPVRRELVKNRVALSWPGKKDYESDGEYRARSALTGTQIERQIAALIQTPEYQQADRETKRLLIDKRVNQVRRLIADELRIGSAADRIAKLKQMLQQTGVQ